MRTFTRAPNTGRIWSMSWRAARSPLARKGNSPLTARVKHSPSLGRNVVRNSKIILGAGLALSLLCGVAWADTVKFTADLEPDKQGGAGKGTGTFTIDTASKTLTGTIEYSGVATPEM